jgi:peptidoglycan/xylan/chitin deacetylase (PgdA/CDA1 family)
MAAAPKLLVTIDTEPDDQWTCRPEVTTENVRRLPRLQDMFDRLGVRPTYLVSYAVAADPEAADILRRFQAGGKCELGAHLHAWNTPPEYKIQGEVWECHPYLYQYPRDVQRAKFETLHRTLTDVFGLEPTSYRAGKYGLDGHGVTLLKEFGYKVDTSVTPMVWWYDDVQAGVTGPDFRRAPLGVYELSEHDVCTPGSSGVLEVPVSIGYTHRPPRWLVNWMKMRRAENVVIRGLGKVLGIRKRWARPLPGVDIRELRASAAWLLRRGTGVINMMFHSSELLPNSQFANTEEQVEDHRMLIDQTILMLKSLGCEPGMTLEQFAESRRGGPARTVEHSAGT